ncbi:MAG: LytTR family DNA-binding domain-containing protein [Acutalibacteraceae bacterium]
MKLFIEQSDQYNDTEITIKCGIVDERLERIIRQIRLSMFSVSGVKDGETKVISLEDIFYFESIDERTFIYLHSDVYECTMKLYELEEQLEKANFVRISKSCIVNIMKLDSVRPLMNSRYEAKLENGEKLIINRHYLPAFKSKFGI